MAVRDDMIADSGVWDPGTDVPAGTFVLAEAPRVLVAPALGSCIGVALWDPTTRRGGLAHVMLPAPREGASPSGIERFATYAVPRLAEALTAAGAFRMRLVAKIAGGASMFGGESSIEGIGGRNATEVRHQLRLLGVPLVAADTGGSHARTVEFYLETGVVTVRSYAYGVRQL